MGMCGDANPPQECCRSWIVLLPPLLLPPPLGEPFSLLQVICLPIGLGVYNINDPLQLMRTSCQWHSLRSELSNRSAMYRHVSKDGVDKYAVLLNSKALLPARIDP